MIDRWARSFVEQYGGRCPVCRTPVHPAVDECLRCRNRWHLGLKVTEAYLAAWGLTVAAAALQSGLGLFLLYLIWLRDRLNGVVVGVAVPGVPMTAVLVLLLAYRRRYCGIARWGQWLMASGAILLLVISSVLFTVFLR